MSDIEKTNVSVILFPTARMMYTFWESLLKPPFEPGQLPHRGVNFGNGVRIRFSSFGLRPIYII
jgi:hypothetical protein